MMITIMAMVMSVMRMMTISCLAWVVANTVSKTEARVSNALRKDFGGFVRCSNCHCMRLCFKSLKVRKPGILTKQDK